MVVIQILGSLIVVALAGVTIVMALVGGLGILGVIHFERCHRCGCLSLKQTATSVQSCSRCRHGGLFHRRSPYDVRKGHREHAA
jgi:hypothetical protein